MSFPWPLVACTALGLGLKLAPSAFGVGTRTKGADIGHLGGALVVTASSPWGRSCARRALAVALGAWLSDASVGYAVTLSVAGTLVALLSLARSRIRESSGTWERFIRSGRSHAVANDHKRSCLQAC